MSEQAVKSENESLLKENGCLESELRTRMDELEESKQYILQMRRHITEEKQARAKAALKVTLYT